MVNTNKLKGAIITAGYSQENLAKKMGIATTTLNNKINNRSPFLARELFVLAELLKIESPKEIFFCEKSNKTSNHIT